MFSRSLRMNLFVAVFVPLTISLGLWQLDRGAQKREMENAYLTKLTELPVAPSAQSLSESFQRIRLKGLFSEEVFLVDNQVSEGEIGYWVIQVFRVREQAYLINRGFIPGMAARNELPQVIAPAGEVEIVGVVWPFTGLIPVYDEDVWSEGWPKRVQRLDIGRMAEITNGHDVELRLEAGEPGVLKAAPFANVLSDAKHLGYAATWFGLCAALIILYGYFVWRQKVEFPENGLNEE